MVLKPFRTPFLNNPIAIPRALPEGVQDQPPAKRRRISDQDSDSENVNYLTAPRANNTFRDTQPPPSASTPLLTYQRLLGSEPAAQPASHGAEGYYNVLYRKFSTKKHKTWDGDGVLTVRGGFAQLQDDSGKEMGRTAWKAPLLPGSMLNIGGKEVEIDSMISKADSLAGKPFLGGGPKTTVRDLDASMRTNLKFNAPLTPGYTSKPAKHGKKNNLGSDDETEQAPLRVAAVSHASTAGFKMPLLKNTVLPQGKGDKPVPRHDPTTPGALVMKRPSNTHGKQIVDVVVDPVISEQLRDHQRHGVQFMYECVMGMRPDSAGFGAVLADEMGLGKTLQIIALLWTLLKQTPYYGEKPVLSKAVIVCPVGLILGWKKEFKKWLGSTRVGVFVLNDDKARITDFTHGRAYSVMIIGYERLCNVQEELCKGTGIDIIVADEGHRLKAKTNKAAAAIKSIPTDRRIILSGTPLQNNLSELYFMVDLINPGILGKTNAFKKEFETPILASRQPGASAAAKEKGEARSEELARLTSSFILRRTAELLADWLPQKTEYVLFCKPTAAQLSVYRKILSSSGFDSVLGGRNGPNMLVLSTMLKKLCNSPSLLKAKEGIDETKASLAASLMSDVPAKLLKSPGASGKLQVLDSLLHRIRTTTEEKVVIVSHWTSTLDIIGQLLSSLSYTFLRLDGTVPASKRQPLVDRFNRTDASTNFAFLLSAKAGGVGINLIGASRLILFDIEWNPSTELQAMARIHRDGQKRPCYIYRFLTQGAIDEKIYQRQLTKLSLADAVVDNKSSMPSFTAEELRDIFSLDESEGCQTHKLLGCSCQGRGHRLATASSPVTTPAAEQIDLCSDDEELPDLPALLKGMVRGPSQADVDAAENYLQKRSSEAKEVRAGMSILKDYRHFDTTLLASGNCSMTMGDDEPDTLAIEDVEKVVEDEILLDILKDKENRVSFLFSKTSS